MKKVFSFSIAWAISFLISGQNVVLEDYFQQLEDKGFSGIIAVGEKGKILLDVGFGYMDKARSRSWMPNTVSSTGSVTKQFTAIGILKLEEAGKLSVKDKIKTYFKDVPEDKKDITIHHLLTHSAGFPGAVGDDYELVNSNDYLNKAFNANLLFEPGKGYEYSNVGFTLAALIIEQLSGKTYEEFLVSEFFKPLGMKNTGYLIPKWKEQNMAFGFKGDKPWGSNYDRYKEAGEISYHLIGNGGILSTVEDMIIWDYALNSGGMLSDESLKKMYGKHNPEPGGQSYYGYGYVVIELADGGTLALHNGGNEVFFADYHRYLDKDRVIYLASNSLDRKFFDVAMEVGKILDDPDYHPKEIASEPVEVLNALPNSPLGETIKSFLKKLTIAKSDREYIEVAKDHFLSDFMDQFEKKEHLSMMKRLQGDLGDRKIVKVEVIRDGNYKVHLKDDRPETLVFQFSMGPSPSDPKFTGIGVDLFD